MLDSCEPDINSSSQYFRPKLQAVQAPTLIGCILLKIRCTSPRSAKPCIVACLSEEKPHSKKYFLSSRTPSDSYHPATQQLPAIPFSTPSPFGPPPPQSAKPCIVARFDREMTASRKNLFLCALSGCNLGQLDKQPAPSSAQPAISSSTIATISEECEFYSKKFRKICGAEHLTAFFERAAGRTASTANKAASPSVGNCLFSPWMAPMRIFLDSTNADLSWVHLARHIGLTQRSRYESKRYKQQQNARGALPGCKKSTET